jgi:hypothetical protein
VPVTLKKFSPFGQTAKLGPEGKIITASVPHCQRQTTQLIVERDDGYVLQIKKNQPDTYAHARTKTAQTKARSVPIDSTIIPVNYSLEISRKQRNNMNNDII